MEMAIPIQELRYLSSSTYFFDRVDLRTRPDDAADVPPLLSPFVDATRFVRARVESALVLAGFDSCIGASAFRF